MLREAVLNSRLRYGARRQLTAFHQQLRGNHTNEKYPMGIHFHVSPVHKHLGTAFGTMTWLWIFWRAKNDGKARPIR